MYVRWKKQKRKKKERGTYFLASGMNTHPKYELQDACLLTAYLVENVRMDGKPKQKILAYLGSINDAKIMNMGANEKFWESVNTRLKALHLKSDQRKDIEQKLQARIPKVSTKEFYKMADLMGHHPRARGTGKDRDQLKAFRERYHLPDDDIR